NVDQIYVALPARVPQPTHVVDTEHLHTVVGRHALGDGRGLIAALLAGLRRDARGAALQREAGQLPAHGAVLEGDDRIGQTHPTQRLRADVRACPASAVNDDRGLWALHELADAQHELAARHADRAGNAAALVFLERPRVDDHHVVALVDAAYEL